MTRLSSAERKKLQKKCIHYFKNGATGATIVRELGGVVSRQLVELWRKKWRKKAISELDHGVNKLEVVKFDPDHAKLLLHSLENEIPNALHVLAKRIIEVAPIETNLSRLSNAFIALAPYSLNKADGGNNPKTITDNNYFLTLLQQFNMKYDGQPERIIPIGHQEELPAGEE